MHIQINTDSNIEGREALASQAVDGAAAKMKTSLERTLERLKEVRRA